MTEIRSLNALKFLRRMAAVAVLVILGERMPQAAPIPVDFDKDAVQFIFTMSGTNYSPVGTCFTVDVASVHRHTGLLGIINWRPITFHLRYFVTAKHVLFDTAGQLRTNLYLRVGNTSGNVEYELLDPFLTNEARVITHPDRSVDLALITLRKPHLPDVPQSSTNNPILRLKLGALDSSLIANKQSFAKRHIREGDDMFFVGLFSPFYGSHENIPICRFGRLAMLTEEKIPWPPEDPQNLYLMETEAFGGNSGAPAFISFAKGRMPPFFASVGNWRSKPILFAGVVKGYFRDWSEVMVVNSTVTPISAQNVGVAAITPAYKLQEILFSPQEEKFRSDTFRSRVASGYK